MRIQAGPGWLISSRKEIRRKIISAIIILGLLAAIFSRFPAQSGSGWYHQLHQPFFAPPYWLPFVMWTMFYIFFGFNYTHIFLIYQYCILYVHLNIIISQIGS